MKQNKLIVILTVLLIGIATSLIYSHAADATNSSIHRYEYATIRWGGRENTHIIRPDGHVEFVGAQLDKVTKPNKTDDRAFYMNIVMNGLAKEGYEFSGMDNGDDIIMKRDVLR